MIKINEWMDEFLSALNDTFADRIWFVGLQGSYGRGEATNGSDIDVVVILDNFSVLDIERYNSMLNRLPHRDIVCGFVSGKRELFRWEPSDLFQFYHDTRPIVGSLDELVPLIQESDVDRAIKIGACNIYHGCVHNILHEKSEEILKGLYKSAVFVVQAIVFKKSGEFVRCQKDLLKVVSSNEELIIETFLHLKNQGEVDFNKMSENLFEWTKNWI